jgi:adenosylcobyric acid synthase
MAKLYVIGIGPGGLDHITPAAQQAIDTATVVVGYKTYLDFITPLLEGKEVVSSGMMKEVERCREAIEIACTGKDVALVSSGDAGVYGMAGLVLELVEQQRQVPPFYKGGLGGISAVAPEQIPLYPPLIKGDFDSVEIVIVPGVSAAQAAASVLGAPLMHDFAVISLSDLLTPWGKIRKRLQAAAEADFVVALYNPRSKGRVQQLEEAREILLSCRSTETPVGIVRNACRDGEEKVVTNLLDLLSHSIDMFSIVIIGNSATFVDSAGRMVTPRGYAAKTEGGRLKAEGESKPLALLPSAFSLGTGNARSIMIGGTGSDVGKSVIAAGICRILKNRGLRVAPFKSQNMALNSAVTPEGGEIGRAQAVQAAACGIPSHTDMNPVLLKPTTDLGSQVIVQGAVVGNMKVAAYNAYKPVAFEKAIESFDRLAGQYDFIVIEGAGSIAEINLKEHDIANLKVAKMANAPVILVADIDRGGVFAQIVGTMELLDPEERAMIAGVIINKFRGDASLLDSGIKFIEERTGVPVLGVVPCFTGFSIPEEDSVALGKRMTGRREPDSGKISIGVVKLPRISNYTDFDPLEWEEDVQLKYIDNPSDIPSLDLLLLPGSKSTIGDITFLSENGFIPAIKSFTGDIAGICGGFQMLGRRVSDPSGVEVAESCEAEGIGLLDVVTIMLTRKETHQATAELHTAGFQVAPRSSKRLEGYEIHMGETMLGPAARPFAHIIRRSGEELEVLDGAVSKDGRIFGTYLHGLFHNDQFRAAYLNRIRRRKGLPDREPAVQNDPFDFLAAHLESSLDMKRLLEICGIGS